MSQGVTWPLGHLAALWPCVACRAAWGLGGADSRVQVEWLLDCQVPYLSPLPRSLEEVLGLWGWKGLGRAWPAVSESSGLPTQDGVGAKACATCSSVHLPTSSPVSDP